MCRVCIAEHFKETGLDTATWADVPPLGILEQSIRNHCQTAGLRNPLHGYMKHFASI